MTGHPDGDLAESVPYSFSELRKEIAILHRVLDIHEHAHQLIAVHWSGTGLPSLNRSGSRISNRRPEMLIGLLTLDPEGDTFAG